MHSPTPNGGTILTGVIAIGARTVWAVGESGSGDGPTRTLILRHQRQAWTQLPAPSPGISPSLQSLAATSPQNIWAVGQTKCRINNCQTLIEHWNGQRWR